MNDRLENKRRSNRLKEFAEDKHLGQLVWAFKWERFPQVRRFRFLCFFLLPCCLILSGILIGIPGVFISIYLIFHSIQRLRVGNVVFLYERGLVDRRKRKPIIIDYHKIQNIWQSIFHSKEEGVRYIFTINMKDGQKYKFDEKLENIEQFSYLLRDQIVRCQLPQIISNYHQGLSIQLGKLTVNQEGLWQGQKYLSWSAFKTVDLCNGQVLIQQSNKAEIWWQGWSGEIDNLDLFLAMVNYIQKSKKRS